MALAKRGAGVARRSRWLAPGPRAPPAPHATNRLLAQVRRTPPARREIQVNAAPLHTLSRLGPAHLGAHSNLGAAYGRTLGLKRMPCPDPERLIRFSAWTPVPQETGALYVSAQIASKAPR